MSDGTPTKIRVWHAARDAYHCAFRMLRLLMAAPNAGMEFERVRVLDMFLLAPPLLHRISMPMDIKESFRQLDIPKPDDVFGRLPSVAAMFQELRVYQATAASHLVARDIFRNTLLRTGHVEFNEFALPEELSAELQRRNDEQKDLISFLVTQIARIPLAGSDNIYKRAGLPGRHLLS
jgi:hypothetical protein